MDTSETDAQVHGHVPQRSPINNVVFKKPTPPRRRKLRREEREECYSNIESLTRELQNAIRDEMVRRKEDWDTDGDQEEEELWETRKQMVYKGLEELADDIQRAIRDRKKEAVLALWSREAEERNRRRSEEVGAGGPLRRQTRMEDGDG